MKALAVNVQGKQFEGRIFTHLAGIEWRAAAAFSLPLVLYLLTLAPTIYNLDSAELTTAAATGGLVRSTGYPLYLALGNLWSRLPLGDVGYRMNLFSAFWGSLTIYYADRTLRKLGVSGWASLAGLGLLATGTIFWGMSLIAEVYTLHTALMSALIYALILWREQATPHRLVFVGLLLGLSLAHHAAAVLLIPGLLYFTLRTSPRSVFTSHHLVAACFGLVLGLGFYLYLPARYLAQPAFNYAGVYDSSLQFHPVNLLSLPGLWWLVTGSSFSGQMFAYRGVELWGETWQFVQELSRAFFVVGIGPGLLGMITLFKRDRQLAMMLGWMFALSAGFFINYRVIDKNTMFLPAYLVFALWIGVGVHAAYAWLRSNLTERSKWLSAGLQTAMLAAVLIGLVWNWRLVDLSADWTARERGEAILSRVQSGGLVVGWWDTVPVIQYLQFVEGQRPDVMALNRFLISQDDLRTLVHRQVQIRPVYIDSPSEYLLKGLEAVHIGPIFRISVPQ